MSAPQAPLYRYEDILRAIGRYVDERQLQDVVLIQLERGILLRGLNGRAPVEHLFDTDRLARIAEEAARRRKKGSWLR